MDWLLQLDYYLMQWINVDSQNSVFDVVFPVVRNKFIWYPFYVFILFYAFFNFKRYKAVFLIVGIVAAVSLGDILSGQLLKKAIKRVRPCNEMVLKDSLITRVTCKNSFSFPSAHATNHFAIASFLILGFGFNRKGAFLVLSWAFIISYAQVYVGLHYPLDVLGGAVLGILIGRLMYNIYIHSVFPENPPI